MSGCGDQWCTNPWDWMWTFMLLCYARCGMEGYAGSPSDGQEWG